ncbi:probable ATP-dependent RNA helicase DDX31 [Macrobrachium nipponense]|uniref:probable ATP-dependent RNA helicase DDX31 n=1 Tax=Macrobrachium nipponense TaxID=159736 RepID=UPI0030C7BF22
MPICTSEMEESTEKKLVLNMKNSSDVKHQGYFEDFNKRKRSDEGDYIEHSAKVKKKKFEHKTVSRESNFGQNSPGGGAQESSDAPSRVVKLVGAAGFDKETSDERRDVLTSLFKGNPEIPYVPQSHVERISEKVFSDSNFEKLDIAPQIVSNLKKYGFTSMTVVQQRSIPHVLAGKDSLIKSQTGSGKTLTYAIPIVHRLMTQDQRVNRTDGLLALIIVPTRELALQSYQWFEKLCKSCVWVVPGYLIGGEKKKAEKARLRKGINILIATPGRLIDHVHHTKSLSLATVKYLVIDEADRLLDLGYERNMTSIMESLKEQQPSLEKCRQTIMLSATLSAGVEKLAGMSLLSPKVIDVSHDGLEDDDEKLLSTEALATPENLSHHYILVPAKLRLVTLAAFILSKCMYGDERKIIIFFATQDMVDYHTALFSQVLSKYWNDNKPRKEEKSSLTRRAERVLAGYEDESEEDSSSDDDDVEEEVEEQEGAISFQKLHGNMTQEDRSSVFRTFKEASAGVLMCTDVAARGLDLPKVCWIVQFNAACTAADYVHRVGRTARVDASGSALIFLAPAESSYIQMLESHKIILQEVKMQKVLGTLKFISSEAKSQHHALEESATGLQLRVENLLLSDKHLHDLARKAYVSFVRSYASYPRQLREMFNFKALHLGHYAKSMGLRDTPSALGASAAFKAKREIKEKREKKEKKMRIQRMRQLPGKIPRHAEVSEFDSGLDTIPKKDRKK